MTITGLVTRIRTEFLDDYIGTVEADYLWRTSHIIAALESSERELCKRLHLLTDSTTPAVCQINVAAVNGVYPRSYVISELVLRVERLKFPGVTSPLARSTTDWLDQHDPGWDETSGTPSCFVHDVDDYAITFNRQPTSGGLVKLTVKRLPLVPISEKNPDTESPEIKQLDDDLIHGALKYLFLRPDLEGYDPNLAAKWSKQFEDDIDRIIRDRAALNPQMYICRPERF